MKLSILIPTIDRLDYLRESLESAQRQTYRNVEILVSDDSATRSGVEYVRSVASLDPRVRLLPTNPTPGLYENYNYLVRHVSGEAFGILDDDDRWLPTMIETLIQPLLAREDVVATFCDHWILSSTGMRLPDETDDNSVWFARAGLQSGVVREAIPLAMKGAMSSVFALFRTSSFQHERFDPACAGAADLDYAIRASKKGALYYVSERLGEYRAHDERTTATQTAWLLEGIVRTLEKHVFDASAHERLRRSLLLVGYRKQMLYVCTRDRRMWQRCFQHYRLAGGSVLNARVGLSATLALFPRESGEHLRTTLKRVRARLKRTPLGGLDARTMPRVEGAYRALRRHVAAAADAPFNRWRYGRFAKYLTHARRIPGWTTTEEAVALMHAVSVLPTHPVIVEVGSLLGKSAVVLGGACKLRADGHVHCIDPFDASGDAFSATYYRQIARQSHRSLRQRFDANINAAGVSAHITVHQASVESLSSTWRLPIDMLYLDGDQSPAGARRAFDTFIPFLKGGGIVAVHNSSDRPYHDGHDGHRRLAVEVVKPPAFTDTVWVGSTLLARLVAS